MATRNETTTEAINEVKPETIGIHAYCFKLLSEIISSPENTTFDITRVALLKQELGCILPAKRKGNTKGLIRCLRTSDPLQRRQECPFSEGCPVAYYERDSILDIVSISGVDRSLPRSIPQDKGSNLNLNNGPQLDLEEVKKLKLERIENVEDTADRSNIEDRILRGFKRSTRQTAFTHAITAAKQVVSHRDFDPNNPADIWARVKKQAATNRAERKKRSEVYKNPK